jgi:hypothetical protein
MNSHQRRVRRRRVFRALDKRQKAIQKMFTDNFLPWFERSVLLGLHADEIPKTAFYIPVRTE